MLDFLLRHEEAHIQASAIVFDLILIFFSRMQVKRTDKIGHSFQVLLLCGTLLTIFETSASWLEDLPNTTFSYIFINLDNMLVFLFIITMGFGLASYYEQTFGNFKRKNFWIINSVIYGIFIIFLIVNMFTGCISLYHYDIHQYVHGPLFYSVGLAFPIYSYIFSIIIFLKNYNNINERLRNILTLTFVIIILGLIFQPIINKHVTVTGLIVSVGLFILYMTVETNDYQKLIQANKELSIARIEADAANKAKSAFLANMSHEIRTPLNAFLGLNDLIIDEADNINTLENAENIKSAGNALLSIVNEILDISKIESGEIEIRNAPYHLGEIIKDINVIIGSRAKDKNIPFMMDIDYDLPDHLVGDASKIRQIIINVLNNSVKYTQKGAIIFTMRGKVQDKFLILKMQTFDTGMGIKKEDLSRLFESYRRVDTKKNKNVEGTGLGLSIVKQSIDMMGGTISVRSNYGLGTTFYVEVMQPIASYNTIQEYLEEQKTSHLTRIIDTFTASQAKILIVDDNEMNLKVACGFLKNTLATLITANGGPESLDILSKEKFDLILLDSFMPILDGPGVLKKIRANINNINYKTPVIVLTADALTGSKEKYLEMGFNNYLSKPVDAKSLRETLLTYLPKELIDSTPKKAANIELPLNVIENNLTINKQRKQVNTSNENLVNIKVGLEYSRNDKELYRTLIDEFIRIKPGKRSELNEAFEKQDWDSYNILTHALKSNAKTIGASSLSDAAMEMEYASRAILAGENINTNVSLIRDKHKALLNLYDNVQEELLWISF